jgi:poly(3-hydroxybutyrate) depolymerase
MSSGKQESSHKPRPFSLANDPDEHSLWRRYGYLALIALGILGVFVYRRLRAPAIPPVTQRQDEGNALRRYRPSDDRFPAGSSDGGPPCVGVRESREHLPGGRSFIQVIPCGNDYRSIILVLHGDGGSASSYRPATPFEQFTNSAVVAYLEGEGATWDLTSNPNPDIAYVEAVVEHVSKLSSYGGGGPVFGSGYSSGGFFLHMLACERPGFLTAIATSAAGAPYNRAEKDALGYTRCKGQQPLPVLAMHGTMDFSVTMASGRFSAQYWSHINGCNMHSMESTGYRQCAAYTECPGRNDVVFCEIPGLGHWVWDEATQASLSFFHWHGKPQSRD